LWSAPTATVLNGGAGEHDRPTGNAGLDKVVFDSALRASNVNRLPDISHALGALEGQRH
jgi:hypothetical protein